MPNKTLNHFFPPASTGVHNNIDNLIFQAEKVYRGYQDGDVVDSLLSLYGGLQAKPSPGASPELSKLPTYSPGGDDNKLFRTLLNLIGRPALIEGELKFPYQRFTLPIGGKTAFTAERVLGLHGQEFIPNINERDLRFTLSRYF